MRKGMFLGIVLWLFLLISLFCLGLGFRTFIQVRTTKLLLDNKRAFFSAVSGIKLAREVIKLDSEDGKKQNVDHLKEKWAQKLEEKIDFSWPKRDGKITVKIEDETARINLNALSQEKIKGLLVFVFRKQGVVNPEEKVNYLIDYTDQDTEPVKLGSFDPRQGLLAEVKNENLSAVEELIYLKDFSLTDYQRVKDVLTVFGSEGKININTIPKELLIIILDFLKLTIKEKDQVLLVRFGRNGVPLDKDDGFFNQECLEEEKDCHVLPDCLKDSGLFTLSTNYFRVTSTAQVSQVIKEITCIVERNSGKIKYWQEK